MQMREIKVFAADRRTYSYLRAIGKARARHREATVRQKCTAAEFVPRIDRTVTAANCGSEDSAVWWAGKCKANSRDEGKSNGEELRRDHYRNRSGGPVPGAAAGRGGNESCDYRAQIVRRHVCEHRLHTH